MTGGDLSSQAIEQVFHLRPTLTLRQLVTGSKGRRTAIRRSGIRRIRLASQLADLLMLE